MTDIKQKNILETRDVKLWYGQKEALHGINLNFPEKFTFMIMACVMC
jgi:phosphate transport system ATP-binding protein